MVNSETATHHMVERQHTVSLATAKRCFQLNDRLTALARADAPNTAVELFLRLCRAEVKRQRMDYLSAPE